jgi:hypothetical protein
MRGAQAPGNTILAFGVYLFVAIVAWLVTGFAGSAARQVAPELPLLCRHDVRALAFVTAVAATIAAMLSGHWWWGIVTSIIGPNLGTP